ncbi:MAG: hypothetical protein RLZZ165_2097 [Bacteroidota bacterium]
MRNNFISIVVGLLALFTACSREQMLAPHSVEVEGLFSVAIPKNLTPCNDLHEFASLQVSDERGDYFLIGIVEPKAALQDLEVQYSLGDYAYFAESTLRNVFDRVSVCHRDSLVVNGLPCQTADFFVTVDDEDEPLEVYYHLSIFEGRDRFYQLIAWSPRRQGVIWNQAMKSVDQSFCELQQAEDVLRTASAERTR